MTRDRKTEILNELIKETLYNRRCFQEGTEQYIKEDEKLQLLEELKNKL